MGIERKELINRRYDENKECVGFEYALPIEDMKGNIHLLPFYFKRLAERYWEVNMISKDSSFGELRAYSLEYELPVKNMNLELVAAYGLRHMQTIFQSEIQYKSTIDFTIGDVIASMLH